LPNSSSNEPHTRLKDKQKEKHKGDKPDAENVLFSMLSTIVDAPGIPPRILLTSRYTEPTS
jgi:hypothetical protein